MLLSLWETYPEISDFAEGPLREFPSFSWIGTHRSTLTLKKEARFRELLFQSKQKKYPDPDRMRLVWIVRHSKFC